MHWEALVNRDSALCCRVQALSPGASASGTPTQRATSSQAASTSQTASNTRVPSSSPSQTATTTTSLTASAASSPAASLSPASAATSASSSQQPSAATALTYTFSATLSDAMKLQVSQAFNSRSAACPYPTRWPPTAAVAHGRALRPLPRYVHWRRQLVCRWSQFTEGNVRQLEGVIRVCAAFLLLVAASQDWRDVVICSVSTSTSSHGCARCFHIHACRALHAHSRNTSYQVTLMVVSTK